MDSIGQQRQSSRARAGRVQPCASLVYPFLRDPDCRYHSPQYQVPLTQARPIACRLHHAIGVGNLEISHTTGLDHPSRTLSSSSPSSLNLCSLPFNHHLLPPRPFAGCNGLLIETGAAFARDHSSLSRERHSLPSHSWSSHGRSLSSLGSLSTVSSPTQRLLQF